MADYYIDPSAGSDASGNGSPQNPWATFAQLNNGNLWARGNNVYIRRGTRMLVMPGTRANINATTGSGRCVIKSYGNGARPIIDGGYITHNPVWFRGGSGIDLSEVQVTRSASIGVKVSPLSGASLDDVTITDVRSYENGLVGSTGSGAAGILVTREIGGLTCTNVRIDRCVAEYNRGHGIKYADNATGRCTRSRASYNGQGAPAHGMGTVGAYVWLNQSSAWTNVGGNVWSIPIGALGPVTAGQSITASQNITEWLCVTAGDSAAITTAAQAHLSRSATPSTPGPNEFGINGQNTLLVNLGGLDPRTLFIKGAYNRPDVVFWRCIAEHTIDYDGVEGQGFQFDDLTVGCKVISCISRFNEGYGFCTYGGLNNLFMQSSVHHNLKGGVFGLVSRNMRVIANTFRSNGENKRAVEVFKGVSTLAMHNTIVDQAIGFHSNNGAQFVITEDHNTLIRVPTPRSNVTAGLRTRLLVANQIRVRAPAATGVLHQLP